MYTESNLLMETNSNDNSEKKKQKSSNHYYTNIQRDCTLHSYACRQGETAGV